MRFNKNRAGLPGRFLFDASDNVLHCFNLQCAKCEIWVYQGFEQNGESAGGVTLMVCTHETTGQAMFSIEYDMAGWGDSLHKEDIGTLTIEKRGSRNGYGHFV